MTEQQQFEIALKHMVRIANAIEKLTVAVTTVAAMIEGIDTTLNELVVQGKSGRSYFSAVTRNSPE